MCNSIISREKLDNVHFEFELKFEFDESFINITLQKKN